MTAAQTLIIEGKRFVLVAEPEFERMADLTRDLASGMGPPLPEPDQDGNVPAVAWGRATLARKLIRDRRAVGLTQRELARRAGIRAETLNRIERGSRMPDTATFQKLHRALAKAEREAEQRGEKR
jgi:DNA-binding XRE family transcriptional regulator